MPPERYTVELTRQAEKDPDDLAPWKERTVDELLRL
jgi:hypothetical protein